MNFSIDTHCGWVYLCIVSYQETQQEGGNNLEGNYIAANLKELRKRKGVTQAEIARALGVPATTYNAWETGQNIPRDDMKVAIAEYYGRTVGFIFFNKITH